jgi:hypothetical protein
VFGSETHVGLISLVLDNLLFCGVPEFSHVGTRMVVVGDPVFGMG